MRVYIVIRSYADWEGSYDGVSKVFADETAAELYAIDKREKESDVNVDYFVEPYEVVE